MGYTWPFWNSWLNVLMSQLGLSCSLSFLSSTFSLKYYYLGKVLLGPPCAQFLQKSVLGCGYSKVNSKWLEGQDEPNTTPGLIKDSFLRLLLEGGLYWPGPGNFSSLELNRYTLEIKFQLPISQVGQGYWLGSIYISQTITTDRSYSFFCGLLILIFFNFWAIPTQMLYRLGAGLITGLALNRGSEVLNDIFQTRRSCLWVQLQVPGPGVSSIWDGWDLATNIGPFPRYWSNSLLLEQYPGPGVALGKYSCSSLPLLLALIGLLSKAYLSLGFCLGSSLKQLPGPAQLTGLPMSILLLAEMKTELQLSALLCSKVESRQCMPGPIESSSTPLLCSRLWYWQALEFLLGMEATFFRLFCLIICWQALLQYLGLGLGLPWSWMELSRGVQSPGPGWGSIVLSLLGGTGGGFGRAAQNWEGMEQVAGSGLTCLLNCLQKTTFFILGRTGLGRSSLSSSSQRLSRKSLLPSGWSGSMWRAALQTNAIQNQSQMHFPVPIMGARVEPSIEYGLLGLLGEEGQVVVGGVVEVLGHALLDPAYLGFDVEGLPVELLLLVLVLLGLLGPSALGPLADSLAGVEKGVMDDLAALSRLGVLLTGVFPLPAFLLGGIHPPALAGRLVGQREFQVLQFGDEEGAYFGVQILAFLHGLHEIKVALDCRSEGGVLEALLLVELGEEHGDEADSELVVSGLGSPGGEPRVY